EVRDRVVPQLVLEHPVQLEVAKRGRAHPERSLPVGCGLAQVMIKEIAVPVLVHPQRVEQAEAIALDVPFGVIRHGWFREVGQELLLRIRFAIRHAGGAGYVVRQLVRAETELGSARWWRSDWPGG